MKKVRIDKWLWSVRIFKSRSKATDACKGGQVRINEEKTKPSGMVSIDNIVQVKKGGYNLTFQVVDLIEKRVGAPIAQKCYIDLTPPEELKKFNDWFVGKGQSEFREKGLGRPTKRERRDIDRFKDVDEDLEGQEW